MDLFSVYHHSDYFPGFGTQNLSKFDLAMNQLGENASLTSKSL